MKLVAAATVLALSTNFAQASRSARRKQRLTSLYEKTNPCFAESICAKACTEVTDLNAFLGMTGRRCKMCASSKLKSCGHATADEEKVVEVAEKPSASFENEPDSREKCLSEKCGCVEPLQKLNRGEKKACKMCARKNGCFRKQSRAQAVADLKKSEAVANVPIQILGHVHNTVDKLPENKVEQVDDSQVYTPDEGISSMDSSEAAAIFGMSSTGNRPLRIMSQQQQQQQPAETGERPGLRIPSSGSPNYPLRMPQNNDEPAPAMSQQTIGRFTFSDKFKRNGWNPFQPEDAPAGVVDVQPDSEEDSDYLDDIYTDSDDMSDALKSGADYEFETEGKEVDFENDDGISDYFQFYESEEDEDADYDAEYAENLENSENLDDDIYTDGGTRSGETSLDSGFNPFSNEQHAEVEAWENPANNALHHESLIGQLPESMQSSNANMKQGDSYPTGLAYGKENSEENKYDHKNTRRTQRKSLRKTTKKAKRVGCMNQVAETCTMCHVPVDGSVESWKVLKGLNRQHDGRKACMACINEIKSSC